MNGTDKDFEKKKKTNKVKLDLSDIICFSIRENYAIYS